MDKEQILALVQEHFIEEEVYGAGYCWVEFVGKPDAFLKFAQEVYKLGYSEGYDDGMEKAKNYNNSLEGIY
jgi:aerobic-type carbon monoxide dehydrogenase small subunit (CoxS/CutS family)